MRFLHLTFVALLAMTPIAQGGSRATIDARTEKFTIEQPNGWVLDTSRKIIARFPAILYPENSSWEEAPAAMYVNTSLKCERAATVAALIRENTNLLRSKHPNLEVRTLASLRTGSGMAEMRQFIYDPGGTVETVAFINAPDAIVIIASSARHPRAAEWGLPTFQHVVRSYSFAESKAKAGRSPN